MFPRRADHPADFAVTSTSLPIDAVQSQERQARASVGSAHRQLVTAVTWLLFVGLTTVLMTGALWSGDSPVWLVVISIAAIGGLSGGVLRSVWIPLVAVLINYLIALAFGLVSVRQPYWVIDVLAASTPVGLGFLAGMTVASHSADVGVPRPTSDRRFSRTRPLIVLGVACLSLSPLAYGTVGAVIATGWAKPAQDCRTPSDAFGWSYEAINYDIAADAELKPSVVKDDQGKDTQVCAGPEIPRANGAVTHGALAGDQVVTEDGVGIAGWYIPAANGIGANGPTIVVVPGAKANKSQMLKYTSALHERYNLVMFDDRGMGQSADGSFAMGALEQRDVRAVVDWLDRTKHPGWMASLGDSLGAATALAEAVNDQRIRAIVLDSMHGKAVVTTGNIIESEPVVAGITLPAIAASWAIVVVTGLKEHADVPAVDPVRTITNLGNRPALLIHGTRDEVDLPEQSAEATYAAAYNAEVPVELHYCANGTHGELVDLCKSDWNTWVTTFLDDARARDQ